MEPAPPIESAVLVPLFRGADGGLRLILVRRGERGVHGGQLAFPGGRRELADPTALDTALREAEEEIGLPRESVEVLATLPAFTTRSTGFRIEPFLARVVPPSRWRPAQGEIAEVIEVPLADLARPEARGEALEQLPGWRQPIAIRFFHVGPHRLWGATYRILDPLLPRLLGGEWRL